MKTNQTTQTDLEVACPRGLSEIDTQIAEVQGKIEDGKKQKVRDLTDQAAELKDQHGELTERKKDIWREDTKLDSLVGCAADELRTAETVLAGMMDKVYYFAFGCIANTHVVVVV